MVDIRINQLPNEPTPNGGDVAPIDGVTTRKTTITALVEAGRPAASQGEAEAGIDSVKAMTPLRVKQAIAFQGAASYVPVTRTVTAGTGLDGGGVLSANITLNLNSASIASLSLADTSLQPSAIGSTVQAFDADLSAISAISTNGIAARTAANTWTTRTIAGTASEITVTNGDGVGGNPAISLPASLTFSGKTVIGGTFSGINATITGGSVTGITDIAIADGGTGASTAANARTNLGLAIGTDIQAFNANLASLAGITLANGDILYATGPGSLAKLAIGSTGQVLSVSGGIPAYRSITGTGDVVGPASSISGNFPTFNGTTGKLIQDSGISASSIVAGTKGYLFGLITSNNTTDATNGLDVAVGSAASDGATPVVMSLTSAITKKINSNWVVGTGNGGLDTGTMTNDTTYHVFLIQRSDTGVVDVLFSTSATAPVMPLNYDRKRRIWSIRREANAILPYRQDGDTCYRSGAAVIERNSTAGLSDSLVTFLLPVGIVVSPLISQYFSTAAASFVSGYFGSAAAASANYQAVAVGATANGIGNVPGDVIFTNTSAQIRMSVVIGAGTLASGITFNYGWIDKRGRLS